MSKRTFNFSAGPATLPISVMQTAQKELLDYKGSGMSIMEMSHRGKIFDEVYKDSITRLRRLAAIPDDFDILYMTGGASTQFALIPLNLSTSRKKAGYINTGAWSQKAIKEAKIQKLDTQIYASSEDQNFNYIPDSSNMPDGLDYVHITSNNTIFGTQFHSLPDTKDVPLLIDMSSDFMCRPIDWSKIDMAYAGMQKNAGPSGATIVVIRRSLYEREKEETPTIWRYSTFAKNDSMFNTPPTFQIYLFDLILQWIENEMGGLSGVEKHNQKKAKLLYDVIDNQPDFFLGHSRKEDRSIMNITWNFPTDELSAKFVQESESKNMSGLKGHRSVGGLRASIYNAMSQEGCQALADAMQSFQKDNT